MPADPETAPAPPPRRLLVRGVNWLGDAVMTTPALLRLRERFPQAHITLLTATKLADLWFHHPAVDAVITLAPGEPPWRVGRRLRAENFDLGLVFPASPRSAWEVWFGRVPRRVGFAGQWRRWLLTDVVERPPAYVRMRKRSPAEIRRLIGSPEGSKGDALPPTRTLPTHAPIEVEGAVRQQLSAAQPQTGGPTSSAPSNLPPEAHQVFHYLHLVRHLGACTQPLAPCLCLSAAERTDARARVQALAGQSALPGHKPWLGLNAGAEYGPAKRWPVANFVAVAREVSRQTGAVWLILGGPNDRLLAAEIQQNLPGAVNLTGRTSLRELMQALTVCDLLLTNDTGPMHLAAALGTPVVALFGSTAPALTGPGLPGDPRHEVLWARVPCAPCFLRVCPVDFRCMHALSVEAVTQAVLRRLGQVWPG